MRNLEISVASEVCLRLNNAVFGWCLRQSQRCLMRHDAERAAQWALLAARSAAAFGYRQLASPELEAQLLQIARVVPGSMPPVRQPTRRRRWLHVLSESYAVGGHTALATRWIHLDPDQNQHSIVLTFQEAHNASAELSGAAKSTGGQVFSLGTCDPLLVRAARLRELAWDGFDCLVLHTHMWDVVPGIALGVSGGPPVLLLNHASHMFWVGGSVADLVLNLRASGQHFSAYYPYNDVYS